MRTASRAAAIPGAAKLDDRSVEPPNLGVLVADLALGELGATAPAVDLRRLGGDVISNSGGTGTPQKGVGEDDGIHRPEA